MKILNVFIILLVVFILLLKKKENFYSDSGKISVIILSYNRPHNLRELLPKLCKYKLIDEIIVAHGSPEHYEDFNYEKVINIKDYKNNEIYGGARRWFFINNIKNNLVLFLDDDLLPSEELVNNSYQKIKQDNKNTIYGVRRRLCNKNGYKVRFREEYNTILTPYLFTKKDLIKTYLEKAFKKDEQWLIDHHGNCEDLALNSFVRNYYKEKPLFIEGAYQDLDKTSGYYSNKNHFKVRAEFCRKYS